MSAFTMASVGTSAAVPVSPPSRAATSATFRMHRQPESIFLSSREHDVTRAPRGSGDGISWVDGIGDAAAVPQRTICASPTSSDSSAAIGPAAFAR
jgi:hypothetical protein